MPELNEWDSFYVIIGSAAGALIGLQFVVMTLIAERPVKRMAEAGAAFSTPTIVHFSLVLLLSAVLRAPWHIITCIAGLWGLVGLGGIVYTGIVIRRMQKQVVYTPESEDWVFHALLPLSAHVILALSAVAAVSHVPQALFGVAASVLLLLFVGIHNAWDAIFYHVAVTRQRDKPDAN